MEGPRTSVVGFEPDGGIVTSETSIYRVTSHWVVVITGLTTRASHNREGVLQDDIICIRGIFASSNRRTS